MSKLNSIKGVKVPPTISFLVLDDQESVRKALITDLKVLNFQGPFHEAENITQAMEALKKEKIDFIFSDWHLKNEVGIDFLKSVKGNSLTEKIPFIMLTTEDFVGNILDAVNNGANGYIIKPWKREEILQKMQFAWDNFMKS